MPIAPTNDHAVTGVDPTWLGSKLHDGRAAGREAEEFGRDFRVFLLAVVSAEGLSAAHTVSLHIVLTRQLCKFPEERNILSAHRQAVRLQPAVEAAPAAPGSHLSGALAHRAVDSMPNARNHKHGRAQRQRPRPRSTV